MSGASVGTTSAGLPLDLRPGVSVVKVYDPNSPETKKLLDAKFPRVYRGKPHAQAAAEIHAQQSFFHTVKEREVVQQLIEEGRYSSDLIESAGLPASFGEFLDWVTHGVHFPGTGGSLPPGITIKTTKTPEGQTVPTHTSTQGASQKGEEEVEPAFAWAEALGKLLFKLIDPSFVVRVLKVLAGAVIILVGVYLLAKALGAPSAVQAVTAAPLKAAGAVGKAGGKAVRKRAARVHERQTKVSPATRKRVARARERDRARTSSSSSTRKAKIRVKAAG